MLVSKAAPQFQPITITLENQEELNALLAISGMNATVAVAVESHDPKKLASAQVMEKVLGDLYHALLKA